jgi:uncharacterized membrane protein YgaE (UPF0421/DUF939 family)
MDNLEQLLQPHILLVTGLGLGIILMLFLLLLQSNQRLQKTVKQLKEKKEKVTWFRQIEAEHERKRVELAHKVELEMQALHNSIETLKKEAKEGTKNQVVIKLEAQQYKRAKLLERTGLSE